MIARILEDLGSLLLHYMRSASMKAEALTYRVRPEDLAQQASHEVQKTAGNLRAGTKKGREIGYGWFGAIGEKKRFILEVFLVFIALWAAIYYLSASSLGTVAPEIILRASSAIIAAIAALGIAPVLYERLEVRHFIFASIPSATPIPTTTTIVTGRMRTLTMVAVFGSILIFASASGAINNAFVLLNPAALPVAAPQVEEPKEQQQELVSEPDIREEVQPLEGSLSVLIGQGKGIIIPSGTITVTPEKTDVGDSIKVKGSGFAANAPLRILIGENIISTPKSDKDGTFHTLVTIPQSLGSGNVELKVLDPYNKAGTASIIVVNANARQELVVIEDDNNNQQLPKEVTPLPETADFFPPKSNAVIVQGKQNPANEWYYGNAPVVRFTATDDSSGVKYIKVWYPDFDPVKCWRGECILQDGDSIVLKRDNGLNKGKVEVRYFAVDNSNKTEAWKKLSLWVDLEKPSIVIRKIITPSGEQVIGSSCLEIASIHQCKPIDVKKGDEVTVEMLASDAKSGISRIYYRYGNFNNNNDSEWQEGGSVRAIPQKVIFTATEAGFFHLQIKASDIAGNESVAKDFLVRVKS